MDPNTTYRALEQLCLGMLEAARRDDWDEVARRGDACQELIASIRRQAATPSTPEQRDEKFRILRRIVEIDGELRELAQPWQRRIDAMLAPRRGAPHSERIFA